MTTYLVYGGQFGSEGKGEVVSWLAKTKGVSAVIRVGGPNAGHTMTVSDGTGYPMRQIPCGWHVDDCDLIIGPGSMIDLDVFLKELDMIHNLNPRHGQVYVDKQAVMMKHDYAKAELYLVKQIGSTGEGIGATRAAHVMRKCDLARDVMSTVPGVVVMDTTEVIHDHINHKRDMIIESTQGFGLSLTLSGHYPYVTSRDITPQQILNDVGMPFYNRTAFGVNDTCVICVVRTFPIRVAGTSGPMNGGELTWDSMQDIIGRRVTPEKTTVTQKTRRISWFDPKEVGRMNKICNPDAYILTFADYVDTELFTTKGQLGSGEDLWTMVHNSEKLWEWMMRFYVKGLSMSSLPAYVSVGPGVFVQYQEDTHVEF